MKTKNLSFDKFQIFSKWTFNLTFFIFQGLTLVTSLIIFLLGLGFIVSEVIVDFLSGYFFDWFSLLYCSTVCFHLLHETLPCFSLNLNLVSLSYT